MMGRRLPLWMLLLALAAPACKRQKPDAASATPSVVVKEGSEGQLYTWLDDKGEFHVEQKVSDVPAEAREVVKVVDPSHDETTGGERVVVADLRTPHPDGTYAVRFMPRMDFDALALERRKQHLPTLATPHPSAVAAAAGGNAGAGPGDVDPSVRPSVIIYGASWCGACHEAARYLKQRGIAYVEKDIETDPAAAREMQTKLARAGLRGGSIPVLDVRGQVMVGFNPRALEDALGRPI